VEWTTYQFAEQLPYLWSAPLDELHIHPKPEESGEILWFNIFVQSFEGRTRNILSSLQVISIHYICNKLQNSKIRPVMFISLENALLHHMKIEIPEIINVYEISSKIKGWFRF
jgi:hypothetical protein